MQMAKDQFKNGFEIINSREINLSNSGMSNETLFELSVSPKQKIPETIEMNEDINQSFSQLLASIKKELEPIKEFQMEVSLLRQEIDLLSQRVNKLIHPELNKVERPIYDGLCELGFENPLALKFTRELSIYGKNTITLDEVSKAFDSVFQNLIHPITIKDGDAIVLFGQTKSGKSKATELIADELFNIGSVHIRKKIDLEIMKKGAKKLLGTHDFSTFRASNCYSESPIRTMKKINIRRIKKKVVIKFNSRSFLRNQVRSMVGCLKYLG